MRKILLASMGAVLCFAADQAKTYTGTVTDDMCAGNHSAMGGKDPVKCAAECVKTMGAKYSLLISTDALHPVYYVLNDQLAGARFSGKKVKVTGTLDAKNVLQISRIVPEK